MSEQNRMSMNQDHDLVHTNYLISSVANDDNAIGLVSSRRVEKYSRIMTMQNRRERTICLRGARARKKIKEHYLLTLGGRVLSDTKKWSIVIQRLSNIWRSMNKNHHGKLSTKFEKHYECESRRPGRIGSR